MLDTVFDFAIEAEASDLHFVENRVPFIRHSGELIRLEGFPVIDGKLMDELLERLGVANQKDVLHGIDSSYEYKNTRFRVHVFKSLDGHSISLRLIPNKVPNFDDLNLPDALKRFTHLKQGLVLVTGITGSGKSTTLASLIELINRTQSKRIITIEDPVEFIYEDKKSFIIQRELGRNFDSFSNAVREGMRQDPDIVLVGELRDLETIQNAITISETGHLVFGTLHTKNVAESFDRIIDIFPPAQQQQIRSQLANVVEGIVSQRLVKRAGGGVVPLIELLVMTDGIRNIVRKAGQLSQINDQVSMNHSVNGSQTFVQSMASLYKKGLIDKKTALDECYSKEEEQRFLDLIK